MTKTIDPTFGAYRLQVHDGDRLVAYAQETTIGTCRVAVRGSAASNVTDRQEAERTVDAFLRSQFGVALADVPEAA